MPLLVAEPCQRGDAPAEPKTEPDLLCRCWLLSLVSSMAKDWASTKIIETDDLSPTGFAVRLVPVEVWEAWVEYNGASADEGEVIGGVHRLGVSKHLRRHGIMPATVRLRKDGVVMHGWYGYRLLP